MVTDYPHAHALFLFDPLSLSLSLLVAFPNNAESHVLFCLTLPLLAHLALLLCSHVDRLEIQTSAGRTLVRREEIGILDRDCVPGVRSPYETLLASPLLERLGGGNSFGIPLIEIQLLHVLLGVGIANVEMSL